MCKNTIPYNKYTSAHLVCPYHIACSPVSVAWPQLLWNTVTVFMELAKLSNGRSQWLHSGRISGSHYAHPNLPCGCDQNNIANAKFRTFDSLVNLLNEFPLSR
jgi:hypothetical protein